MDAAALDSGITRWFGVLKPDPVPAPEGAVTVQVTKSDWESRFQCPSAVTPAQQTVSPWVLLGCGSALTRMVTRPSWGVTDIDFRVVSVEIEYLEPRFLQLLCDDRTMAGLRISLEA